MEAQRESCKWNNALGRLFMTELQVYWMIAIVDVMMENLISVGILNGVDWRDLQK